MTMYSSQDLINISRLCERLADILEECAPRTTGGGQLPFALDLYSPDGVLQGNLPYATITVRPDVNNGSPMVTFGGRGSGGELRGGLRGAEVQR